MKTLEEIVKDIEKTEAIANMVLEELPTAVRPSWAGRILKSQNDLKDLKAEYRACILRSAVAIFTIGDAEKSREFGAFVVAQNEGVVVDASALYKRIADSIEPTLAESRQFGVTQTYKLHQGLQEVMHEVGLQEMPMPDRALEVITKNYEAVVDHVRNVIRGAAGDMLNRLYVEKQIADAALSIRYIGGMTPVVVLGALLTEHRGLAAAFNKGSCEAEVKTDDTINQEFMENTFKEVNKKIRKPNKTKTNN